MRKGLVRDSEGIVKKELQEANKAFRAFASTHEGYAVVLEEFEELKERFDQTEEILKNVWLLTKQNATKETFKAVLEDANAITIQLVAEAVKTAAMFQKFEQFNGKRV